jgi:hypothetical protein
MSKYPRVVKFKTGGSFPGCIAVMPEPGTGTIIYIPFPVTGGNIGLALFEQRTITESEVDTYAGKGVVLKAGVDPAELP